MSQKPSKKVEELFLNASELSADERAAYLDNHCKGDAKLRKNVEDLLNHYAQAQGNLMAQPAFQISGDLDTSHTQPVIVGNYKVRQTIGVGGMGVVYQAVQENPHRTVAIKVIRPGLASKSLLSRFKQEAEVLARLHHPGIAHIYEAGVAVVSHEDGSQAKRPFFAMEFIEGLTLTEYAERQNLNTRARLDLMTKVCDAVHHAHQKGVIHRDLKPQNILVDEDGQPKILDFGVARATDGDMKTMTSRTEVGQLVGTVSYMSPEQVLGDSTLLDTRSDIYTLGVILFELLSKHLPYKLNSCTVPEAARIIQDEDPARLSKFGTTFRGDLETIVQKALEKEKSRRYSSAALFALDLRRYLQDEPILARPQSRIYQIRKFAKRNVGLVSGVAIAFLALVVGTSIAIYQAVKATEQALVAQSEAQRKTVALAEAEEVTVFLTDMLATADPFNQKRDIKVSEVLEMAAGEVDTKWNDKPLIEARLRQTIGRTYNMLGKYEESEHHLSIALDLQKQSLGTEDDAYLETATALGVNYRDQGRFTEAEALFKEVMDRRRNQLGDEHRKTLDAVLYYGSLLWYQGKYERAEACHREAFEGYERTLGSDHKITVNTKGELGVVLRDLGRLVEAEACIRESVQGKIALHGETGLNTLHELNNLGGILRDQGQLDEAETCFRKVVSEYKKQLGSNHAHTLSALNNLGVALHNQGKFKEAEMAYREIIDEYGRIFSPDHTDALSTMNNLGQNLMAQAEHEEAESIFRKILELTATGHEHHGKDRLCTYNNLGHLRIQQEKLDEAEEFFVESLALCRQYLGSDHPNTQIAIKNLGGLNYAQGELEEALRYYSESIKGCIKVWGKRHSQSTGAVGSTCLILEELGRAEETARYKAMLKEDDALE